MKWKEKKFITGDTRTRHFFAWLPVSCTVDDVINTRWLEFVTVKEQCYVDVMHGCHWTILRFDDTIESS